MANTNTQRPVTPRLAAGVAAADTNARDQLQPFNTATLVAAARGLVDLNALAVDTLADRGLDPVTGAWVGFDAARKLAADLKGGATHG